MKYDTLRLENSAAGVSAFINNQNLINLLREYEIPFAASEDPSPQPGGYGPITKSEFLSKSYDTDEEDDLLLFNCEDCGENGCWPMVVKIERTDNTVIWHKFQQPHRDKTSHTFWDYSHFGPFIFAADEYKQQIAKLE